MSNRQKRPSGRYIVRVRALGFEPAAERRRVRDVGAELTIDLRLPAAASSSVRFHPAATA